jgi:hypothetical protein
MKYILKCGEYIFVFPSASNHTALDFADALVSSLVAFHLLSNNAASLEVLR